MTDAAKFVEYHPTWPEDYHFFVDEVNWPRVQALYKELKVEYSTLSYVATGHPYVVRPGVRFGSSHLAIEAAVADALGLVSHGEAAAPPAVSEPETVPIHGRRLGRPPGPVSKGLVPFDSLTKIGQTLVVIGKYSQQSLRLHARSYRERTGIDVACLDIKGPIKGVILVVKESRELYYDRVVEL